MARLLPHADFPGWLDRFLPGIADGRPAALFTPAVVTNPSDGYMVEHWLPAYAVLLFS